MGARRSLVDIGREIDAVATRVAKNARDRIETEMRELRDYATELYYSEYAPRFYKRTYQLREAIGYQSELVRAGSSYSFDYRILFNDPYGAAMMDHSFQSLQDDVRTNSRYTRIVSRTWETRKFGTRTRTYKYLNVGTYTYDGESSYSPALEEFIIDCFANGKHPHAVQGSHIANMIRQKLREISRQEMTTIRDELTNALKEV